MDISQERRHLCVVCRSAHIVEHRIEHTVDGDQVPDQCNCGPSTYDIYPITGGRILMGCGIGHWHQGSITISDPEPGGICTACLDEDHIRPLVPYIKFLPW